jgi:hypothetical protein
LLPEAQDALFQFGPAHTPPLFVGRRTSAFGDSQGVYYGRNGDTGFQ